MDIVSKAIESTADFSPCRKFRFTLTRKFPFGKGKINFIMLNPSTADENYNDPTIARCEKMALRDGFEYMAITNLFPYRATDPKDMKEFYRGLGESWQCMDYSKNLEVIEKLAFESDRLICAWGNHGNFLNTSDLVREILDTEILRKRAYYLELNKSGEPKHPLYISSSIEPQLLFT